MIDPLGGFVSGHGQRPDQVWRVHYSAGDSLVNFYYWTQERAEGEAARLHTLGAIVTGPVDRPANTHVQS